MNFAIGITIFSLVLAFAIYELGWGGGERKNGRRQQGGWYE